MNWGEHPGEDDAVNFFEFKKRVLCQDYSESQVIALNSESNSKGTGGLMSVHNVDFFGLKYFFSLRVVSDKVGKTDIRSGNDEVRKIVSLHPVDVLDSIIVGRVTVGHHDHLSHSFLQNFAHLLYVNLDSSQTGVKEIAYKCHCQVLFLRHLQTL